MASAVGFALGLALAGCASTGPELNLAQLAKIRKGLDDCAEVEQILGKPMAVSRMPDGKITAKWPYSKRQNTAENSTMIGYDTNLDQTIVTTHAQMLRVDYDEPPHPCFRRPGRSRPGDFLQGPAPGSAVCPHSSMRSATPWCRRRSSIPRIPTSGRSFAIQAQSPGPSAASSARGGGGLSLRRGVQAHRECPVPGRRDPGRRLADHEATGERRVGGGLAAV